MRQCLRGRVRACAAKIGPVAGRFAPHAPEDGYNSPRRADLCGTQRRRRNVGHRVTLPPLRDRIRPGVRVLFVGINPGVRSAQTGHHFAGFSNRFWKLLYDARLVPEPVTYVDDERLPDWGYGVTNVVPRATPGIDTLTREEYIAGCARLRRSSFAPTTGHRGWGAWSPRA